MNPAVTGFPDQQVWHLELPHEKIVELIDIIEGYEGMAVVRVLSKEKGVAELLVAPDMAGALQKIIEDLNRDFPVKRIGKPEGVASMADDP